MRKITYVAAVGLLALVCGSATAQKGNGQTVVRTVTVPGVTSLDPSTQRSYTLFLPASYTPGALPIGAANQNPIVAFHASNQDCVSFGIGLAHGGLSTLATEYGVPLISMCASNTQPLDPQLGGLDWSDGNKCCNSNNANDIAFFALAMSDANAYIRATVGGGGFSFVTVLGHGEGGLLASTLACHYGAHAETNANAVSIRTVATFNGPTGVTSEQCDALLAKSGTGTVAVSVWDAFGDASPWFDGVGLFGIAPAANDNWDWAWRAGCEGTNQTVVMNIPPFIAASFGGVNCRTTPNIGSNHEKNRDDKMLLSAARQNKQQRLLRMAAVRNEVAFLRWTGGGNAWPTTANTNGVVDLSTQFLKFSVRQVNP